MIKYYGDNKGKRFFQAWYFKLQCNSVTVSFVPGVIINKNGEKRAFIKVDYGLGVIEIEYDYSDFIFDNGKIIIGENEFSEEGIKININNKNLKMEGEVRFSRIVTLKKKLMPSLKIIKFMQCNHEVVSLRQYLNGALKVNNSMFSFIDGIGYIESIYGRRTPKEKIWIQCSDKYNYSLMISIEPVDGFKKRFLGCAAFIYCNGQEYKITTIKGGKVITYNKSKIIIKQGRHYLEVNLRNKENKNEQEEGEISSLCTKSAVLFKVGKKSIINQNTDKCSYQYNFKKSV